jgi:hypothetical protein
MILHKNVVVLELAGEAERRELELLVNLSRFVVGEISPTKILIETTQLKKLIEAMEAHELKALVRRYQKTA